MKRRGMIEAYRWKLPADEERDDEMSGKLHWLCRG